ncbi:MAG: DUF2283 domain-containing protein [Nitrososphaerales archaeon]
MAQTINIKGLKKIAPILLSMPSKRIWVSYDDEADVLYMSFEKPQKATDSDQRDDVIIRYRGKTIVGVTLLNASKYLKSPKS